MLREREHFIEFIRDRGLRLTPERLALLDEIYSQHGHIDAEELLAAMRRRGSKTSRATVYRNLELLVECGLVRKQLLAGQRHVYEHVHLGQRHDHLVCRQCGRIAEFVSPGIEALQTEICRAHGFDPNSHALQILGICTACRVADSRDDRPRESEPERNAAFRRG